MYQSFSKGLAHETTYEGLGMRLGMPGNHHGNWASLHPVIRNVITQYGSRASADLNYLIWLPPLDGGIRGVGRKGEGEDGRMVRAEPGEGEDGRMVRAEPGEGEDGRMVMAEPGEGEDGRMVRAEPGEGEDGRMVRAEPGEGEDGRMVDWRYKGRRKSRKGSGWR